METTLKRKEESVVLLGAYSPTMFQPEWFSKNHLLPDDEVEAIQKDSIFVTPAMTTFNTSQFRITITPERLEIVCIKEPFLLLKTLVINLLVCLGAISIYAYGYNYLAYYSLDSIESYKIFGDILAPKKVWKHFFGKGDFCEDKPGGLHELTMLKHKTDNKGSQNIIIQSTNRFERAVLVKSNNHFNLSKENNYADAISDVIKEEIDQCMFDMAKEQQILLDSIIEEQNGAN